MAINIQNLYNPVLDMFPDLKQATRILAPVRVGVDRRTGRMKIGWSHVQQSMEVIFVTRFHERVLRRWVGSFVPHLLGENAIQRVITRFYWAIASALDLWEPNYAIVRVRVIRINKTTGAPDISVTAEDLRSGHLTVRHDGVYRPRGHLGDPTPESRRIATLVGSNQQGWEATYK